MERLWDYHEDCHLDLDEENYDEHGQLILDTDEALEARMKKIYFEFYQETYKKSKIDRKTKELIAIAAALGFKCQGCLNGHIKKAKKFGATPEEISETIAIAMGVAAASVVDLTDIAAEHLQIKHFE